MLDRSTIKRLASQVFAHEYRDNTAQLERVELFAHAIKQAVLIELDRLEIKPISAKQEPVAWAQGEYIGKATSPCMTVSRTKRGGFDVPIYAAPVVPDGMVMVPRVPTLTMLDCLRADTTPNLEKRYKAMIAAAEKEQGK